MSHARSISLGALALLFLAGCAADPPAAPRALAAAPRRSEAPHPTPNGPPASSLTLTLRVAPKPSPLPVSFTADDKPLASFSLTDAGATELPNGVPAPNGGAPANSITFQNVLPGVYHLGIHTPPGIDYGGISCTSSDGSHELVVATHVDASIRVPVRAAVLCTLVAVNPWLTGEMLTYSQFDYGDPSSPAAALVMNKFNLAYPSELDIGDPAHFELQFSDGISVVQYLPDTGGGLPLVSTYFDPTDGDFGYMYGEVLALKLNVDFDDLGLLHGPAALRFGDLRICDLTAAKGLTVRQFLAIASTVIGGGAGSHGITFWNVDDTLVNLDTAFERGAVSPYSTKYLVAAATCP
jgi:hypothetical protein